MKLDRKKIWTTFKNKYVLALFIFVIWILFFDQNNLLDRWKSVRELRKLESEKKYYLERIDRDTERLKELRTNKENLEKFAREQYLMKKENEDIFIIVEEE